MKKYNFTREETVQALKVCSKGGVASECRGCSYKALDGTCVSVLLRNALILLEKESPNDAEIKCNEEEEDE